jgi:hypothetical protein
MWWIGCVRCEKFRHDLVARTCALMAPVQAVLHWSLCSNETARDAPKHEFGVQRGGSGAFVAKNSDARFTPKFVLQRNSLKCPKTRVGPMGWIGCVCCKKFQHDFVARIYALIASVQPVLHQSSWSNGTFQNAPKHEFGVKCGASGAFVAKNSDATPLHELVH